MKETIGYAVGDFGINLYFISAMTYLLFFYTDIMGLSATAAAGVMAVARIVDAVGLHHLFALRLFVYRCNHSILSSNGFNH